MTNQAAITATAARLAKEAVELSKKPARTRAAPKALNKDARTIKANADADKARKAASKKALREAMKSANVTEAQVLAAAKVIEQTESVKHMEEVDHGADNLAAAMAEAEATGMSFEAACESMGIDPQTGKVAETEKPRYQGPMLALVAARKSYAKAANGNPCNGDEIATAFGSMKREDVVTTCIKLLNLPGNPYTHLNPGQQSMNLRNKLRHAVKTGEVTMAAVRKATQPKA